ncbi:uncharacterized protein [Montipora capricornis]|uniref:uncharacterized protein n=1 Tax=Montipora foliosa TaxID=591990 RepID=UPI0035F17838
MRSRYLLTTSILCALFFCEARNNKDLTSKLKQRSLLKFFKQNNEIARRNTKGSNYSTVNTISATKEEGPSHPFPKCGHNSTGTAKRNCTEDAKSGTVKKSFRPHDYDYDDDDDEDYDDLRRDYDEYPEDNELPEEDTMGSYRAFEDSPPTPRDPEPFDEDSDYEDDHGRGFGDEYEPRDRPGYEDDLDRERERWDWEPPRRHHDRGRVQWHRPRDDVDDETEHDYSPRYRHYPRNVHHHRSYYRHPEVHASYKTLGQARVAPLLPFTQGYQNIGSTPVSLWTNSPGTQTNFQPPYLSSAPMQSVIAIGPSITNPYLQGTFTSSQGETNPFVVTQYKEGTPIPPYLTSTSRNFLSFSRTPLGYATSFPRQPHETFQYPRFNPLMSPRMRPFRSQMSRSFLRRGRFPNAVFNRIAHQA